MMLLIRALPWLAASGKLGWVVGLVGLGVGFMKSRLIFVPMATRNMERIEALSPHKEKICIFAFQANQSYLIIALMIGIGITLRLSPLPRLALGAVYTAIGSALLLTAPRYFSGTGH